MPQSSSKRATLALVSCNTLGDGLLNLVLAKNLHNNGYDVTYWNSHLASFQGWVPWFPIKDINSEETIYLEKKQCDLMILDPLFSMYSHMDALLKSELEGVTLFNQKLKKEWHRNNESLYIDQRLKQLARSQSLRDYYLPDMTMVDVYAEFMQHGLKLKSVDTSATFVPPHHLVFKKNRKRILIFPYTPNPDKNWKSQGFVKLSDRLKLSGFEPEIIVTRRDRKQWNESTNHYPCLSHFESIADLASYVYESGLTISNDSGGGHLASFLGIDTITIYRKRRPLFIWRPGWAHGEVVCPLVSPVIVKKRYWHNFISISKIVRLSHQLININD